MDYKEVIEMLQREGADLVKRGHWSIAERYQCAVNVMKELQQYKQLDILDGVRGAVDKQQKKKPLLSMNEKSGMFVDYADGHGEYKTQMNNWWRCHCCNSIVGQRVIVHNRTHDQRKKKICEDCGQAMDWSVIE